MAIRESFLRKICGCGFLWHSKSEQFAKVLSVKIVFFINPRKFSPSKVFRYTVHCMGVYQTAVLSNETFLNYSIDTGILEWKLIVLAIKKWMVGRPRNEANCIWLVRLLD